MKTIQDLINNAPLRKTVGIMASGKLAGVTSEDYLSILRLAQSIGFTGCGSGCSRRIYVFLDAKCKEIEAAVADHVEDILDMVETSPKRKAKS